MLRLLLRPPQEPVAEEQGIEEEKLHSDRRIALRQDQHVFVPVHSLQQIQHGFTLPEFA